MNSNAIKYDETDPKYNINVINPKYKINEINPEYVDKNGVFIDMNIPLIYRLSDTEIWELRQYYKNEKIAINRKIYLKSEAPISFKDNKSKKRKYKMTRGRISNGKIKAEEIPKESNSYKTIVGSIVISLFILGGMVSLKEMNEKFGAKQQDSNDYAPINQIIYPSVKVEDSYMDDYVDDKKIESDLNNNNEVEEFVERRKKISHYCDIYQVNFGVVYPTLVNLTDNFSSKEYLSGHIKGVTCKGEEIYAETEDELLLYAVRCMKQLPKQLGISDDLLNENELYKKNGYESPNDYMAQLDFASKIIGVDRRLLYAIVQTECGFDSAMFNSINNPAGIVDSTTGTDWIFDTKEEGFLELAMEIRKYYRSIGEEPTNINYNILKKINDIHAPGNDYWLEVVIDRLEYAQLNEAELFGDVINNYSTIIL